MRNRNPRTQQKNARPNSRFSEQFPGARDPQKSQPGSRRVYVPRKGSKVGPQGHLHSPRGPKSEFEAVENGVEKFSIIIRNVAQEMDLRDRLDPEPAPLAKLDYETELKVKNAAIRKFWTLHNLPDKPSLVIPSPLPRHYRSTSKRRIIRKGARWEWDFFLERMGAGKGDHEILEPHSHAAIFAHALAKLNEEPYRNLANSLNFLIVRGDTELMVIFNVFRLNADSVRKTKMLAEHLKNLQGVSVAAAHVFYDSSRSNYYIEAQVSPGPFRLKRLFGPEFLPIQVGEFRYFLHPTGFFQVNPSILPRVIAEVENALKPGKTDRFLDMYCGCGLFTFPVSRYCDNAVGVEGSATACDAARQSAAFLRSRNTRFISGKIDAKSIMKQLPPPDGTPEVLLLDPPRQGTAPGLIPALAERKPRRVAYMFCEVDTLPAEVSKWRKQGYMLAKVLPFDMFPGTNNLEVLVVLLPDKFGLLNRKPKPQAMGSQMKEEIPVKPKPQVNAAPGKQRPPMRSGMRGKPSRKAPRR